MHQLASVWANDRRQLILLHPAFMCFNDELILI